MRSPTSYTTLVLELLREKEQASLAEIYDYIEQKRTDIARKEKSGVDWRRSVRGRVKMLAGYSEIRKVKKGTYELLSSLQEDT